MRLWYLERGFHRRLRTHVQEFRREIRIMLDVFGHFDQRAIERETGGPALSIMQELSSSGSASTSAPDASASGANTPDDGESGDGKTTYNVEMEAGAITLSRVCTRAAGGASAEEVAAGRASAEEVAAGGASAEEVAAGGASAEEVAAGGAGLSEEATRAEWIPGRIKKKKPEGASSSSSGKSTDSLTASASTLQEPSLSTSGAVVVDTLLASLQESEASAASDAMDMLQKVFTQMSEVLSRHVATADSILRQEQQRSLVVLGDDGEVEEQEESPPTPRRQLVLDVGLMHSQMHSTQCCLSWSVAKLKKILDELPPTPSAVRLPPPAAAGGHLARFSQIFKKPFSRNK